MAAPKGACLFAFGFLPRPWPGLEKIRSIWLPSFSFFNFLPIDLCATAKGQPCDTYFLAADEKSARLIRRCCFVVFYEDREGRIWPLKWKKHAGGPWRWLGAAWAVIWRKAKFRVCSLSEFIIRDTGPHVFGANKVPAPRIDIMPLLRCLCIWKTPNSPF